MASAITTQVQIGDGAMSEAFNEIINVTNAQYDGIQWDNQEITALNAAGIKARKYVSTLYAPGNITFTIVPYVGGDTQHALLMSKATSGDTNNFKFVTPSVTYAFAGFVSMKPVTPVDGVYGYDVTIMGTGEVTVS